MAKVMYHYALDESDKLVSIDDVTEKDRRVRYFCLQCGALMVPRMGKIRHRHFAHSKDVAGCGPETYLHKLAKCLIKEKFDRDDKFEVGFYCYVQCSDSDSCVFFKREDCRERKLRMFDLKQYYDACYIERQIDNYIADVLLVCTENPKRKPLLIEIQVSHKSTKQKIESGLHVIEIHIDTEEGLETLLASPIVERCRDNSAKSETIETSFYGFRRNSMREPLENRSFLRFYLFRSGKAYVTNFDDDYVSCRRTREKINESAIFEASFDCAYLDSPSPYEFGYILARQKGLVKRVCMFCKYSCNEEVPTLCCLYKKIGTPRNPEPGFARVCQYYIEDCARLDRILNQMPAAIIGGS